MEYIAYQTRLTAENAAELVRAFDVVIDASDNMLTRYLVNDACVLEGVPLVSGAAIGAEGYCTVYNHMATGGPCYRCIYGSPPPAATVASCSENGVLGVVPGVIGCMQAVEALKILSGMPKATALPLPIRKAILALVVAAVACPLPSASPAWDRAWAAAAGPLPSSVSVTRSLCSVGCGVSAASARAWAVKLHRLHRLRRGTLSASS